MVEVVMPKLGMQTVEVDIVEIVVSPGQMVHAGDALLHVESEKADVDIVAECDGVVEEVLVSAGDIVEPGHVLVRLRPPAGEQMGERP